MAMAEAKPNDPSEEPVDAEIVDEGPAASRAPAPRKTFYHPWSGAVILGIDWLAFGLELPTEMMATPIVSVLAFAATYFLVRKIQLDAGDEPRKAGLKALLGAIAAGVPFPVTGTVVGTAILLLSGLSSRRRDR